MRQDIINTRIEASDQQNVEDIVVSSAGDYKFAPQVGFGAIKYIKSNVSKMRFIRNLNQQLEFDGYKRAKIDLSKGIEELIINI